MHYTSLYTSRAVYTVVTSSKHWQRNKGAMGGSREKSSINFRAVRTQIISGLESF